MVRRSLLLPGGGRSTSLTTCPRSPAGAGPDCCLCGQHLGARQQGICPVLGFHGRFVRRSGTRMTGAAAVVSSRYAFEVWAARQPFGRAAAASEQAQCSHGCRRAARCAGATARVVRQSVVAGVTLAIGPSGAGAPDVFLLRRQAAGAVVRVTERNRARCSRSKGRRCSSPNSEFRCHGRGCCMGKARARPRSCRGRASPARDTRFPVSRFSGL